MATDLPGILIVDDNEDNRYTLQLMLETDGHERIASAAGGNEAIALIEKEKFSLILLDLMMPDLNGDEVLKVIKSDPDKRDISVVMISADTNVDKVSQCIELGADDYLPKPFNPTILRARIGAALRRHSLRALENEYLGKIENEKRHSENLLRNILPAEIVTRLRNGESNIDLDRQLNMIDLNIKALVALTYVFLKPMRERRQGTIINVASTAAFQPVPFMANYAATKAFVLPFSEALWEENRRYGVTVMALCPGVTETNFFEAAHGRKPPARASQTPEEVVDTAIRGLNARQSSIVSGWMNLMMVEAERFVPRSWIVRVAGKMMRSEYEKEQTP